MKSYALLPFVLQAVAWPVAHFIFRITGSFTVEGYAHIKNLKGPFVFAANHVNDLDPVLTRAILPMVSKFVPLFWVARYREYYDALPKDEQFDSWRSFLYSDLFFRVWGAYPALKGTGDYEQSLKNVIPILQDGYSVCIFPQGGKEKKQGREGAPIRGGAAFLAKRMNAPLVPLAISGTLNLGPWELFFGRRKLKVSIGKPVYVVSENYKEEAEAVMRTIHTMLDRDTQTAPKTGV